MTDAQMIVEAIEELKYSLILMLGVLGVIISLSSFGRNK